MPKLRSAVRLPSVLTTDSDMDTLPGPEGSDSDSVSMRPVFSESVSVAMFTQ